jgi:outer membrane protein OmpA-like peptidoglycan-associated protein
MMRIPAVIGLMSATLVLLSTGEPQSERLRDRVATAVAAHKAAAAQFVAARNQEITASLAAVQARRAADFADARNAENAVSLAAVENRRDAETFAEERNREIAQSIAAVENARMAEFTAARNAEINLSVAAVAAQREMVALAQAWNQEIAASIAAVERARMVEFAQARNAEITASLAAVAAQRELAAFADARNAEITASIAAVEGARMTEFAQARNAEIKAAMMAYELQRTSKLAMVKRRGKAFGIETGSIESEAAVETRGVLQAGNGTLGGQACQSMVSELGPIYWTRGTAALSEKSKHHLDELAAIAKRCVSMVIEVHGHSDGTGSPGADKRLSERRARTVADYLVDVGVDAKRVVAIGHGAEAPVVSGDAPESMTCNRRIEFSVQHTDDGPKLSEILRSFR